jgi:hypothetical protein
MALVAVYRAAPRMALIAVSVMGCDSSGSSQDAPDAATGSGGSGAIGGSGSASAGAGSGGVSGSGGGAATSSGGVAGVDSECPTEYALPHHSEPVSSLCPPWLSTQCDCPGLGAQQSLGVECSPDGAACVHFVSQCDGVFPPTWECGWLDTQDSRIACPELVTVAEGMAPTLPCASDESCREGHYCSLRVANRMFCDDVFVARAEDVCGNGGAAGAGGAAGSG